LNHEEIPFALDPNFTIAIFRLIIGTKIFDCFWLLRHFAMPPWLNSANYFPGSIVSFCQLILLFRFQIVLVIFNPAYIFLSKFEVITSVIVRFLLGVPSFSLVFALNLYFI